VVAFTALDLVSQPWKLAGTLIVCVEPPDSRVDCVAFAPREHPCMLAGFGMVLVCSKVICLSAEFEWLVRWWS